MKARSLSCHTRHPCNHHFTGRCDQVLRDVNIITIVVDKKIVSLAWPPSPSSARGGWVVP